MATIVNRAVLLVIKRMLEVTIERYEAATHGSDYKELDIARHKMNEARSIIVEYLYETE